MAFQLSSIIVLQIAFLLIAMPRFSILLPAAAAPIRDARQIDVNNNNNNQTLAESLMNGLEVSSTYAFEGRNSLHTTTILADFYDTNSVVNPVDFCTLLAYHDLIAFMMDNADIAESTEDSSGLGISSNVPDDFSVLLQDLLALTTENVQEYCQLIKQEYSDESESEASMICSQQEIAKLRRDCIVVAIPDVLKLIKGNVENAEFHWWPCRWVQEKLADQEVSRDRIIPVVMEKLMCSSS